MAELFKVTHAVESTDEEGNVSYVWTDDKAESTMVNIFIVNNNMSFFIFKNLKFGFYRVLQLFVIAGEVRS